MNLQAEVHHRSEDVADVVLLDVVKAIRRCIRGVNHDYDIPYIAGYSVDGYTVFIDRHLPRTFRWLMGTVRVEPFLLTHEIVEKALLDKLRLHLSARASDRSPGGTGRGQGRAHTVVDLPRLHEAAREAYRGRETAEGSGLPQSYPLSR
jgi:hypothetical protein